MITDKIILIQFFKYRWTKTLNAKINTILSNFYYLKEPTEILYESK